MVSIDILVVEDGLVDEETSSMNHQSKVRAARLAIDRGAELGNEYMLSNKALILFDSGLLLEWISVESLQTRLWPRIVTPFVSVCRRLKGVLPPILANGPSIP